MNNHKKTGKNKKLTLYETASYELNLFREKRTVEKRKAVQGTNSSGSGKAGRRKDTAKSLNKMH